jgi:hypothetical protein
MDEEYRTHDGNAHITSVGNLKETDHFRVSADSKTVLIWTLRTSEMAMWRRIALFTTGSSGEFFCKRQ